MLLSYIGHQPCQMKSIKKIYFQYFRDERLSEYNVLMKEVMWNWEENNLLKELIVEKTHKKWRVFVSLLPEFE